MSPDDDTSHGPLVTLTGTLEIDRLPSGKRFQGTWLLRPDSPPLLLSYRPIEEHLDLAGQHVIVTGRHHTPSPEVQQVNARHFTLETLTPHPDTELEDSARKPSLPPAPLLQPSDDLGAMHGRWVHVQGTALEGTPLPSSTFYRAPIALIDGSTTLLLTLNEREHSARWLPLVGQEVTVLGKLWIEETPPSHLSGPNLICAGHVIQCGSKEPETPSDP